MQKAIRYTDFFNFFLSQPIAVLRGGASEAEIVAELQEYALIPLTYIRDRNHPFFISTAASLKELGVTQRVKLIIIPIGYIKQFLA